MAERIQPNITTILSDTAQLMTLPQWLRTELQRAVDELNKRAAEIERLKAPRKRFPTRALHDQYGLGQIDCLDIEDALAAHWNIELEPTK